MKTIKPAFVLYAALVAAFMLCLTACIIPDSIPGEFFIYRLEDAEEKLADFKSDKFYTVQGLGASPERPVHLMVKMDFGDLSQPDNEYLRLLDIIGKYGLYAELSLGSSKTGKTTVFTSPPMHEAARGMDKIAKIYFPATITSIMADTNGRSPFFFYENLRYVEDISSNRSINKIGDSAFSGCKSLERVEYFFSVETIGNEAFRGCENLKEVRLGSSVKEIGTHAFFDCSALEVLNLGRGNPPILGEAAFLGSTPSRIYLCNTKEDETLYPTWLAWLAENASKFNNNGADVVF